MKKAKTLPLCIAIFALGSSGVSQETVYSGLAATDIAHEQLSCMSSGEFPFVETYLRGAAPPHPVDEVRVYFRAQTETEWYYVSMRASGPRIYEAALPMPLSETAKVVYYVEFTFAALR